ncbi:hypothetical protein [Sphingobium olei]|uniref:RDD family protein n=2 Tax=Sphingobium olei TaxID=420955 RepID=A0ABW3P6I8_9SPHN
MMTPNPLIVAATRRFEHRSFRDANGIRMVRNDGKRAVWLTSDQHQTLVLDFARTMQPVNAALKWGFILTIPITIMTLSLMHSSGLDRIIDGSMVPGASFIGSLIILTWWPLLVVAYHWFGTRRAIARVEASLADMPSAPLPSGRPVAFQTLEIVALFIVGPALLIDVIGSLFPRAFDHTPMMGREMGLRSVIGLAVFAALVVRRYRLYRTKGVAVRNETPSDKPNGRVAAIAARAREQVNHG